MVQFQFFIKSFIGILFFGLFLFVSAGRIDYYQGWIYLFMSFLGMIMSFISVKGNSSLMEERSKPGKDTKSWDKLILGLSALVTLISFVVAGLDSGRFHWSKALDFKYCILGVVITFLGQIIFLIAKMNNNFFSSVVRIQTDRGHSVCDSGLYKFVRHPGYLGMIISLIGFPLLIGSLYSIIPTIVAIILILVRTKLEDKTLIKELPGYDQYINKTRFRLIPGLW